MKIVIRSQFREGNTKAVAYDRSRAETYHELVKHALL